MKSNTKTSNDQEQLAASPTSPHPKALKILQQRFKKGDKFAFPPSNATMSMMANVAITKPAPIIGSTKKRAVRNTNLLIVLVEFSDVKFSKNFKSDAKKLFFTGKKASKLTPYGCVKSYYDEVSGGIVNLGGDIFGPYTLPNSKDYYANKCSGMPQPGQSQSPSVRDMASDAWAALIKHQPKLDLSKYHKDANNWMKSLVIIQPSPDASRTTNKSDIWPLRWVMRKPQTIGKTKVRNFLTISGTKTDFKIGTPCHELGHLLFDFPDLYDMDKGTNHNKGIGNWGLMGSGNWLGGRNRPCHPSAYCKALQGWVTVKNIASPKSITIDPVIDSNTVYRLSLASNAATLGHSKVKEYLLLENRQQKKFDAKLPGKGLLIWHIDENQTDNRDNLHPRVGLIQADGKNGLLTGDSGNSGDPYPGKAKKLTARSNPKIQRYDGVDCGANISSITEKGEAITIKVGFPKIHKYVIHTKTGTKKAHPGGKSDKALLIRLHGKKRLGDWHTLDNPGFNDFEYGATNGFVVKSDNDLGDIKKISLKLVKNAGGEWYGETITVRKMGTRTTEKFSVSQMVGTSKLDIRATGIFTAKLPVSYMITTKTNDNPSGHAAQIKLIGTKGTLNWYNLDNRGSNEKDDFEKYAEDKFAIRNCTDYGEITKIGIRVVKGSGGHWGVDWIKVQKTVEGVYQDGKVKTFRVYKDVSYKDTAYSTR